MSFPAISLDLGHSRGIFPVVFIGQVVSPEPENSFGKFRRAEASDKLAQFLAFLKIKRIVFCGTDTVVILAWLTLW